MTVDIKKLKQMTAEAVARGEEKARKAEEARLAKEDRQRRADRSKADCIIEQIPDRAEREANQGRNHAIIMAVKYDDYVRPTNYDPESQNYNHCNPKWLKGAVKLVFEYCVEANLNPTLEHWHDGCGMQGGHNIVIHW